MQGLKKVTAAINGSTAYQKDSLVWIAAKPVAGFVVRDTLSCSVSRAFNFTNNSIGASPLTYTWKFGDNTTATTTHPYKTYATAGNYTVWLIAKTALGCTDSASKVVNPSNSSLNTAFTIDTPSLCLKGNAFTVTNTSSPSSGTLVTYELNWGDGATTAPTGSVQHSYKNAGTYVVKLKAASTAGCSDSVLKSVQVHPQPVADFISNPFIGCAPLQTQLTNSSWVSGGTLSYLWELGQGDTSTKAQPSKTFTVGRALCYKTNSYYQQRLQT
ncbi:PKD domain-containing protein [Oscillatoria amoena NRMC-F 0135]|nr:PKD domain-containing protein [Oscillatoria amoena NRMC-F 0135]